MLPLKEQALRNHDELPPHAEDSLPPSPLFIAAVQQGCASPQPRYIPPCAASTSRCPPCINTTHDNIPLCTPTPRPSIIRTNSRRTRWDYRTTACKVAGRTSRACSYSARISTSSSIPLSCRRFVLANLLRLRGLHRNRIIQLSLPHLDLHYSRTQHQR